MSCGKQEEENELGEFCQGAIHNIQAGYQEQILIQQQLQMQHHHHHHQQQQQIGGLLFPEVSPNMLPCSFNPPPPPPSSSSSSYGGLFNRRQYFGYDHHHMGLGGSCSSSAVDHLRMLSDTLGFGQVVQPAGGSGAPFGLQGELGKMTAQEIMDAKALAASKSHSEAERRRRERINNHLAKLRSLLPSTTKTDKASLLAEVIQHVRELKRQTSLIAETSPVPTETDELTVDAADDIDEDGKFVIKASLCCEDRSDLLPELIKTLKALHLKPVKAEITTLGGRVKNVLFIAGEEQQYCISSIQEALKAVMEKTNSGDDQSSSGSVKRQRTNISIIEHRSL